jgi:hypothetical protein
LKLHCTNYVTGALVELGPEAEADWRSAYMDAFLDGDFLARWLEGRSLSRPWEEGNNIVNVASYLALAAEDGQPGADSRLQQVLDWHRQVQNPRTGGFDCFDRPSINQRRQALAGAVHNFHIHLYLGERLGCEELIASWIPLFLLEGRQTACLSLDMVELAVRTIEHSPNPQLTMDALTAHVAALLGSQRPDGGWLEAADDNAPTVAAGFYESPSTSCSYATWFRMCSLGMFSVFALGSDTVQWRFRSTLGMGYAPRHWP